MSILEDAKRAHTTPDTQHKTPEASHGQTARLTREATVTVNGEQVTIKPPSTVQSDEDQGSWLTGTNEYGIPRGTQALENRQIVQTSAMQAIVNGVADQILGGELVFESSDEDIEGMDDAAQSRVAGLRDLIREVLTGPHLQNISLDDLITAAVEDMMGPGQAYWQLLSAENADIPVVSLIELDPLTIRHNVDKHGVPGNPPYWQAQSAFAGGEVARLGNVEPTPLQREDLAVMSYPKGHRSYHAYPISPAWQVREWLEILANSTTHHNRFYSDNEIPPGLIQIVNASGTTVKDVKEKIQDAAGDPRDVPIIGGEGGAQWLDMGGTAVNLNVIEEQKWFFQLCLGAVGLGKQELGFIEDVNRSNGEVESTRVYKRVAGPFIAQFEHAFLHVARRFDAFTEMGEPFTPTIKFSDPREERAREQRLREMYQAGGLSLREYVRRRGDTDLAEDPERYTVETSGGTVDYGAHPRWVAQKLLDGALGTQPGDEEPGNGEE